MAPVRNSRVLFIEAPLGEDDLYEHLIKSIETTIGLPAPGKNTIFDESQTIDLETVPLNGGFLIKTLAFGVDPFITMLMRVSTAPRGFSPV